MNDSHLFMITKECMLKANYTGGGKARIGCIAVYHGAILAKGYNSDKTHSFQAQFNQWRYKDSGNKYLPPKMHAELAVLQRLKYLDIDFSKLHLYIYRETRNGKIANCRPCSACMAAIKERNVKHIHYTTEDGYCHETLKKSR